MADLAVANLAAVHLDKVTDVGEGLDKGRDSGRWVAGRQSGVQYGHGMNAGHVLAGQMVLLLEVVLGDLDVAESHFEGLVTEQVHESGKADAGPKHGCCIGMPKPMGRNASGIARFSRGLYESFAESKIACALARFGQQ
jgi:hypothetical protein